MKGLDLFLVLLILLSWRRCFGKPPFQQQDLGLHALVTTTWVSYLAITFASSSPAAMEQILPPNIDSETKWMKSAGLENLQNLSYTTASPPSEEKPFDKIWEQDDDFQHPQRSSSTDGLKNTAHYFYAHDEDFDEEDLHTYVEEGKESGDDDGEDENNSFLTRTSSSSEEYIRDKISEHRRLGAYLRKHHYQHVKRLRLLRSEEEERGLDGERFNASTSPTAGDESATENPYHPSTSFKDTTKAMREDDEGSEHHVKRDQRLPTPHQYNRHDFLGKSKEHVQHSKQVRSGTEENYRNHHLQHNDKDDPEAEEELTRSLTKSSFMVMPPSSTSAKGDLGKRVRIGRDKVFRHSNRFLDKFYLDTQHGYVDPENLSELDLNVSTISELIWRLRGMRSRRWRSFQAMMLSQNQTRNFTGLSDIGYSGSGSNTIDTRKLLLSNVTWPLKRIAEIEKDIWLGGLMMVHEREDNITCGPIMPQGGVQSLEAMLYTIDWINNQGVIPGVKIGAYILDDCDKDTYGLEQAVDFIKGSISNIDDVDLTSTCSDGGPEYPGGRKHRVIAGVVGAASSVTSIQVANLLRLFKIPQLIGVFRERIISSSVILDGLFKEGNMKLVALLLVLAIAGKISAGPRAIPYPVRLAYYRSAPQQQLVQEDEAEDDDTSDEISQEQADFSQGAIEAETQDDDDSDEQEPPPQFNKLFPLPQQGSPGYNFPLGVMMSEIGAQGWKVPKRPAHETAQQQERAPQAVQISRDDDEDDDEDSDEDEEEDEEEEEDDLPDWHTLFPNEDAAGQGPPEGVVDNSVQDSLPSGLLRSGLGRSRIVYVPASSLRQSRPRSSSAMIPRQYVMRQNAIPRRSQVVYGMMPSSSPYRRQQPVSRPQYVLASSAIQQRRPQYVQMGSPNMQRRPQIVQLASSGRRPQQQGVYYMPVRRNTYSPYVNSPYTPRYRYY